MAWSSGRSNCSKPRISDSDSSSEEENSFVSSRPVSLRSCNIHSVCCHSSFTNDLASNSYVRSSSPFEENSLSENFPSCSNIKHGNCPQICSTESLSCSSSHSSHLPQAVKKSNISLPSVSSDASSPPVVNVKLCKSMNIEPMNALLIRGVSSRNTVHSSECMNVNDENIDDGSYLVTSAVSRIGLVDSTVKFSSNSSNSMVMGKLRTSAESSCSQQNETNAVEHSSCECDAEYQNKSDKVCNLQHKIVSQHGNLGNFYNWQATMTTVKERFAFLFNNEILSDVHFRVGKGESIQRIPAHKFVLAVGSAVFDAMFNGKLCTQQEEIELPDVEPQAFLALLRFLYSDEVEIGPESVMTVLYTAKKYAVPALERQCVEYLKCNLSPDNAFMLLTQARLFDEPQLAALCLDTIDKNTNEALSADGFTDIDHSTLCTVLERDTLRIREAKLFQAVVRWSENKCSVQNIVVNGTNQRNVLGRALSLIRFPLMTIEEFAQGPAQSNILMDKEIVQLFLYFTVNPKLSVNFLDVPRCCMTGKEQTVCRFQQIESRWGYSGTSDRIRFIVDRRIFVVGFGMYGSIHGPSEYEITIQIIHTGTGKVCISNDTTFASDGSVNTFRVMFKEPFEVLPNTNYTAYATLKGPDSHYGTKGVRKISVECPSGDRVTFQFTYAAGYNNGTSVEDGQIPEIIFHT